MTHNRYVDVGCPAQRDCSMCASDGEHHHIALIIRDNLATQRTTTRHPIRHQSV